MCRMWSHHLCPRYVYGHKQGTDLKSVMLLVYLSPHPPLCLCLCLSLSLPLPSFLSLSLFLSLPLSLSLSLSLSFYQSSVSAIPSLLHMAALNNSTAIVEWLMSKHYSPTIRCKRPLQEDGTVSTPSPSLLLCSSLSFLRFAANLTMFCARGNGSTWSPCSLSFP